MLIYRAFPTPTSTSDKDQTTTPGTPCPTLCEKCVGSLTSPAKQYREDAGDGTYSLSSLSEKTRTSNHLHMSLQRQHILLSYFKTLSVGPVWGSNPRPPAWQSGALPTELTRLRSVLQHVIHSVFDITDSYLPYKDNWQFNSSTVCKVYCITKITAKKMQNYMCKETSEIHLLKNLGQRKTQNSQ